MQKHLPYLDGIRGFCALYVVFFHACNRFWLPAESGGWGEFFTGLLGYGHAAVTMFIVLSGFSLGLGVAEGKPLNYARFFKRRLRRIVPPCYAALLFAIALAIIRFKVKGIDWLPDQRQLVLDLLLLNDIFPDWDIATTPLWSVGLEAKIYCLFPVLVLLHQRYSPLLSFLFASSVSAIACAANVLSGFDSMSLWYVVVFALGFLASQKSLPYSRSLTYFSGVALLLLIVCFPVLADWSNPRSYHNHFAETDLALGLFASCLLQGSLGMKQPGTFVRWLSSPIMVLLGAFSYSLYLVHSPLLVFWDVMAHELMGLRYHPILFSIGVMLSLIGGWLFYLAIEQHFVRPRQPRSIPI